MRLEPWEHFLHKFEIQHEPNGKSFKYLAFGVSLDGSKNFYGSGFSSSDAFSKMVRKAIDSNPKYVPGIHDVVER